MPSCRRRARAAAAQRLAVALLVEAFRTAGLLSDRKYRVTASMRRTARAWLVGQLDDEVAVSVGWCCAWSRRRRARRHRPPAMRVSRFQHRCPDCGRLVGWQLECCAPCNANRRAVAEPARPADGGIRPRRLAADPRRARRPDAD